MAATTEKSYFLLDVVEHSKDKPNFEIPSKFDREHIRIGDYAKVCFELKNPSHDRPGGERMWLELREVNNGRFYGVLDNKPVVIQDIKWGDTVEFGPENIAGIMPVH